jgi:ankyrin repeat protein
MRKADGTGLLSIVLHIMATLTSFISLLRMVLILKHKSNGGWRALHYAACNGNLPFIQELISRYHVDINARENDGTTALWLARHTTHYLHRTIIAFLQANGGIE